MKIRTVRRIHGRQWKNSGMGLCLLTLVTVRGWTDGAPPVSATVGQSDAIEFKKLSLQELMDIKVTTVSRVDERIDEAPGSVYVYTREMIQQRGYRSLGELLQVVPGFTVFHRDLQSVAGVRGLTANDNEKITLMINGVTFNQVDEPDFLNGPINLDNVERVEVVVGPSSFFQPANTLAATVNVITKNTDGVEVLAAVGTALTYSGTLLLGKTWDADKYLNFSFTTEQKRGYDAWNKDFRPNLAGKDLTGKLEQPNFFSVLKGQLGDWSGQVVGYYTTFPELLINESSPTNHAHYVDQMYMVSVRNDHHWNAAVETIVNASATYKKSTRMNDGHSPDAGLETANAQTEFTSEIALRYTGFDRHLIQAGFQGGSALNSDSYYVLDHSPTTLVDDNTYYLGVYLDDTFAVTSWLKLIAGIRVDHNTVLANDHWYPGGRAAIVVTPMTNWVSKLIYNHTTRMPAPWASPLNEAWGSDIPSSPSWATNSTTARQPEMLHSVEWQNIVYWGSARLSATVYYQQLKDFISWYGPHTNIGDFDGPGAELDVRVPLNRRLTLWANASYNNSKLEPSAAFVNPPGQSIENHHIVVNPDGRIIGAPLFTANGGCDFEIIRNLVISPSLRYFTDQAGYSYSKYLNNPNYPGGTDSGFITIRNRFYFDATVAWKHWKVAKGMEVDLRLSGYNLLNNQQPVAMQWGRDTYTPRGISGVLAMDVRF
jgi:outer membrane receptor protein involved in Fe transport